MLGQVNEHDKGLPIQPGRGIPPRLAPVVQQLELYQRSVLTIADLRVWLAELAIATPAEDIARDLQRHGWLLPLRTRGAWEFAPAVRAGAFSGGDRLIELRATLRRRPELPLVLAYDSAAFLHGFGARIPNRHVLAVQGRRKIPSALSDFRVVRTVNVLNPVTIDGLPVWSVATLLVKIATAPHFFRDWPNAMEWLPEAFARVDIADLEQELNGASVASRIRLAYLADRAGRREFADLSAHVTSTAGPIYLGRARGRGHYVRRFDLIDALLIPTLKT